MGKGNLPEEKAAQAKPTLKPPTLITPEVVQQPVPLLLFVAKFRLILYNNL